MCISTRVRVCEKKKKGNLAAKKNIHNAHIEQLNLMHYFHEFQMIKRNAIQTPKFPSFGWFQ